MRQLAGPLRAVVEHDARRVDHDECGFEEGAEVGDALVEPVAVPRPARLVVHRAHPVLHREGERGAAVVLGNGHVHEAVRLDEVARDLGLLADFPLGYVHFLVFGGLGTVEFRRSPLNRVVRATDLESHLLGLARVLGDEDLLHLAGLRALDDGAQDVGVRVAALFGGGVPGEVRLKRHFGSGLEELVPSAHLRHAGLDHLCEVRAVHDDDFRLFFVCQRFCRHDCRCRHGGSGLEERAPLEVGGLASDFAVFTFHVKSPWSEWRTVYHKIPRKRSVKCRRDHVGNATASIIRIRARVLRIDCT